MKKFGLIALCGLMTTPAIADIASKDYVDNAIETKQDKLPNGTTGQILKKTASGIEWANETTTTLETTTGQSGTNGMTQKAITDELNKKLENTATGTKALAIGSSASAGVNYATAIGPDTVAAAWRATAIGHGASAKGDYATAIGHVAYAGGLNATAIGMRTTASAQGATAIGYAASAGASNATAIGLGAQIFSGADDAIQLGAGMNNTASTFNVGLGNNKNYTLLESDGTIPAGRLTGQTNGVDNNGVSGQVLTSDGNGGMTWTNVPTLASLLPVRPDFCTGKKCALVWNDGLSTPTLTWELVLEKNAQ